MQSAGQFTRRNLITVIVWFIAICPRVLNAIVLDMDPSANDAAFELAEQTASNETPIVNSAFAMTLFAPTTIVGGDTLNGNFDSFLGDTSQVPEFGHIGFITALTSCISTLMRRPRRRK